MSVSWWRRAISVEDLEDQIGPPEADGMWRVLVEQMGADAVEPMGGLNADLWEARVRPEVYADREEARAAMMEFARGHEPDQPRMPKERVLLRHDDDTVTVVIRGAMRTLYFRVSVCQQVR